MQPIPSSSSLNYADAALWNKEVVKRAQDLANMGYVPCAIAFGTKAPFNKYWQKNNEWIKIVKDFMPGNANSAIAHAVHEGKVKYQNPNRLNLGVLLGATVQGYDQMLYGQPAAIDVDVNDPARAEFLDHFFDTGETVRKFGSKGFTQFVRVKSAGFESTPKNMTLSSGKNKAGIEFLYTGRQTVIPPSVYLEDWRQQNDSEAFKNSQIYDFQEYIGKDFVKPHVYKWLTDKPLWEVPIAELPELTPEHYTELMIYISNPEATMFNLHKAVYLGQGQGGDYRFAALSTVASMLANKFTDAYIHKRCAQLARAACIRGGTEREFEETWDVESETDRFLAEAKAKFATGTWTESAYTSGNLIQKKIDTAEKSVSISKRLLAVNEHDGVSPKTLVSNRDFDEKNYAAMFIDDQGGKSDWVQLIDYSTRRIDPDYVYHFLDGYWHKIPINPRDGYLKVQIEQKYGLNSRQSARVLESLSNYVTHVDRKTFEQSRTRYIKVLNGTFDIETMEIVEDDRNHACTSRIENEYGKIETFGCPMYEAFLDKLFTQVPSSYFDTRTQEEREKDKAICIQAFEEWMGYSLIKDTSLTRALFLKGRAQTGKNVALRLLKLFHSTDQISQVSLDELHLPIQRAVLTETAVNICDEVGKREIFSEKDFKKIVLGEGVSIERKYENPRHNVPITSRLAFALNDFPSTVEINNSLERRMLFLSCNNVISDVEKDPKMTQKLSQEKNGIFIRWVTALRRFLDRGDFILPMCHRMEIDQFRRQNDPLADFIDSDIEQVGAHTDKGTYEEVWTEKLQVYEAFRKYSEAHGVKNIYAEKTFSNQLSRYLSDKGLEFKRRMIRGERQTLVPVKLRVKNGDVPY